MTARIERLASGVLEKTIYPEPTEVEYDKFDLLMPDVLMETKRVCDYIRAQDVALDDGFEGLKRKIAASKRSHAGDSVKVEYLDDCAMMCDGMIAWEEKCAAACRKAAKTASSPARVSGCACRSSPAATTARNRTASGPTSPRTRRRESITSRNTGWAKASATRSPMHTHRGAWTNPADSARLAS